MALPKRHDRLWNILTILIVSGILLISLWAVLVYTDPQNQLNPYPPPTLPISITLESPQQPSVTLTSTMSFTESPLPSLTSTTTPLPTWTLLPFQETQQAMQQITQTQTTLSVYQYEIQGEPSAIPAVLLNSTRQECNWMGVGGQVLDLEGRPVTGILVQLSGTLDRQPINQFSLTGTALNYGPSGYEFQISTTPVATMQTLYIRLLDQSNIPLSGKVFFNTYADEDCSRNLVIINFKQVRP